MSELKEENGKLFYKSEECMEWFNVDYVAEKVRGETLIAVRNWIKSRIEIDSELNEFSLGYKTALYSLLDDLNRTLNHSRGKKEEMSKNEIN
jgi:hypothetical protein